MEQERIDYFEENIGCDYILETRNGKDFTKIVSSMVAMSAQIESMETV